MEALRTSPLFFGLPEEALDAIIPLFKEQSYKKDTIIFKEGEPGDRLFFILSGKLALSCLIDVATSVQVATLSSGDVMGEMALLSSAPRSLTATAVEDTKLLELSRSDLEKLKESKYLVYSSVTGFMANIVCRRLTEVTADLFKVVDILSATKNERDDLTNQLESSRKGIAAAFFG